MCDRGRHTPRPGRAWDPYNGTSVSSKHTSGHRRARARVCARVGPQRWRCRAGCAHGEKPRAGRGLRRRTFRAKPRLMPRVNTRTMVMLRAVCVASSLPCEQRVHVSGASLHRRLAPCARTTCLPIDDQSSHSCQIVPACPLRCACAALAPATPRPEQLGRHAREPGGAVEAGQTRELSALKVSLATLLVAARRAADAPCCANRYSDSESDPNSRPAERTNSHMSASNSKRWRRPRRRWSAAGSCVAATMPSCANHSSAPLRRAGPS